jgi:hypothetical protein
VADEDFVLDVDATADEAVALHLAARADPDAALDLDEWPDRRLVAYFTTEEVDELVHDHVTS